MGVCWNVDDLSGATADVWKWSAWAVLCVVKTAAVSHHLMRRCVAVADIPFPKIQLRCAPSRPLLRRAPVVAGGRPHRALPCSLGTVLPR